VTVQKYAVGQVHNRLTIIGTTKDKRAHLQYLCRCECGKEVAVYSTTLKKGNGCRKCSCIGRVYKKPNSNCAKCGIAITDRRIDSRYCSVACRLENAKDNYRNLRKESVFHTLRGIVTCSRMRCKRRGREHDLDTDYLMELLGKQEGRCAISGRLMLASQAGNRRQTHKDTVSVDRIDSSRGYTKDNVQLVTVLCNTAKSSFSMQDFLEMCRDVVAKHGEGSSQEGSGP